MKISDLAKKLDLEIIGNSEIEILGVSSPENAKENQLTFIFEDKYYSFFDTTKASVVLTNKKNNLSEKFTYLISNNPKLDMAKVLEIFEYKPKLFNGIHKSVFIGENCNIDIDVSINPFVYIGSNVVIKKGVTIFPHSYIGDYSIIDENTIIYPNVTIAHQTKIGKNVIIHSGTVIGSDGYGFIQTKGNVHYKIPQIGNVIIEDDVEIGANVSIDRGTTDSTIIKKGTKIDNMVHIAHNVKIGERSLLVAQSGIAGSSELGSDCVVAGQAGISGHLKIGSQVMILGKSGVTKDLEDKSKVSGFPARDHKDELKQQVFIKKLPKLIEEINELKKRLNVLDDN
jgi:UDP-3-O-[3-hydroxymyristoyl] glucosamine N-acyltransferase